MLDDFDPKKQVMRLRKGRPIVVDKAVIRWRKRRRRQKLLEAKNKPVDRSSELERPKILDKKFF